MFVNFNFYVSYFHSSYLTRLSLEPGPPQTSHFVITSESLGFLEPDESLLLLMRGVLAITGEGVDIVSVLDVATNICGPDEDAPSPTGIGIGLI